MPSTHAKGSASKDRPLVSIIVPSFNQGHFIAESLDSILSQSYRPIEIIVMDGASTDNTVEVLKSYEQHSELRWVSEPDDGPVDAVNKALALANGELAGIQSTDDIYLPDAIALAVDALVADPGLSLVYGDALKVDEQGEAIYTTDLPEFSMVGFFSYSLWLPQSTTFFRTQQAIDVGGWRQPMAYAADTDLWMRLAFVGRVRKLAAVMGTHRRHEAQRDSEGGKIIPAYLRMIESCKELASQPEAVRRAAAAGNRLITLRYGFNVPSRKVLATRWRAAMEYPPVSEGFDRTSLVPGYGQAQHRVRQVRNVLHRLRTTGTWKKPVDDSPVDNGSD